MRKRRPIKKAQRPIIMWENKIQLAIWELLLKGEIEAGFWSKSKFETLPYLSSTAIVYNKAPGTTITPSLIGFNFGSKKFTAEQGYYVAMIIKLVIRFDLSIEDLQKLLMFADSLVSIDFLDDNSEYRRIQVSKSVINENEMPEAVRETISYFKNLGVDINEVSVCLRDKPFNRTQIRKVLDGMSEVLKTKVEFEELVKLSKS